MLTAALIFVMPLLTWIMPGPPKLAPPVKLKEALSSVMEAPGPAMNWPLLMPPPAKSIVPALAASVPRLVNGIEIVAVPLPAVLMNNPELLRVGEPPALVKPTSPLRLRVPPLLRAALPERRIEEAMAVVPLKLTIREEMDGNEPDGMAYAAAATPASATAPHR